MSAPAVRAEGLTRSFGPKVRALDGVSLEVAAGSVLGLLGPNGAGKTSTVNVLTTLLRPDSGYAEVAGISVTDDPAGVRRVIGLAGQFAAVDESLTGRENLMLIARLNHLPKRVSHARTDEMLSGFGLDAAADRATKTYSGGMRRRLDLAAALVAQPQVLFLDEPTTGLDPRSRNVLWGVIDDLVHEGTTVLLTTQYLEEADRLADRISVVDRGRVVAEGTPAELKARLGGAVVEVRLADPDEAGRAARILAGTGETEPTTDGELVRVPAAADGGTAVLTEVVRRLDVAQIRARALALREPSLDDVFLSLTDRTADLDMPSARASGRAASTPGAEHDRVMAGTGR